MRFARNLALLSSFLCSTTYVAAQETPKLSPNGNQVIVRSGEGEQLTVQSKILQEERTIYVSLPERYNTGVQRYPVLYLTDAQWQFEQTRSTARFLARERIVPEMIIVGVTNRDRTRDLYSTKADFKNNGSTIPFPNSGNGDQFLEFFEKELLPWVDATYRSSSLRVLAGHSAGGNFALHAIRTKPGLFQAAIAISPWLAWDNRKELNELLPFLASDRSRVRAIFVSYSDEGAEMKGNVEALINTLRSRRDNSVRWGSAVYSNEDHNTTVLKGYYDGLRMIFDGWSYPRDQQTNLLIGTLDDVKAHYSNLGAGFGVTILPPENVVNEFGYQYLQTNNFDAAIKVFQFNTVQYPQSANVWDSLGEAYLKAKDKEHALAAYKRSLELNPKNENAKRVIEGMEKPQ
jgi:predicted alpha/beta superfamily hydrolase